MIGSFIFFTVLLALCLLFSRLADKTQKKVYVWLIIGMLTVTSGFRGELVGIDTANYLMKFEAIGMGRLDLAYSLEESFKYIVYLLLRIIPSGHFVLLVLAFLTQYCIIARLWELRKTSNFTCMVLCYYMMYFFTTMNTVRQFCAVAIVFYSVRFLDRKQIIRFLAGVLVAALFHLSALIGILYLAFYCLRWNEFSKRQKAWIKWGTVSVGGAVILLGLFGFFGRYLKYFTQIELDIGLMLPLKLCFVIFAAKTVYEKVRVCESPDERFRILTAGVAYVAALLLGMLGYLFRFMDRVGWYFFLYEGVFFGMLFSEKNLLRRILSICFVVFVLFYGFVYSIFHNSQGQVPYTVSTSIVDFHHGISICGYRFNMPGSAEEQPEGIVRENGLLYYYEDGQRTYGGLILVNGEYYYVKPSGQLVVNSTYVVVKTNEMLPAGEYRFNRDGKLIDSNTDVTGNSGNKFPVRENFKSRQ